MPITKPQTNAFLKSLTKLNFLLIPLLSIFSFQSFGQSADLDQVRNGSATSRVSPAAWVNGNAGPENAHYAQGYSIPYRMKISSLVGDANKVHELVIEWDTKDQNEHALDYITHYNNMDNPTGSHQATFGHAAETIDPTIGTAFSGAPALFQIPAPSSTGSEKAGYPTTSFNNLPTAAYTNNADITKMAIWGGTITALTYVAQQAPDATTGTTKTSLKISFKSADGKTALLAWGGHISADYDWGAGRATPSGSPYHTRLISIDGKGGNQDRSLKSTAVIIPPPLCGISPAQFACPETGSLQFSAAGSSTGADVTYAWTLTNGATSAGAKIDGSNTGFNISVVPIGSDFIPGGTFNLSLVVTRTGATPANCSLTAAGTIINTVVTASASPTVIDLTSAAHSTTLTAEIGAGSTFPSNADYTYLWEIVSAGATGSLVPHATEANKAIYTAGINDLTSITFKVTATLDITGKPACIDDETVAITIAGPGACDVTGSDPVCSGTEVTHEGSPDPIAANTTYKWTLEGYGGIGTTTSTINGADNGVDVKVNALTSYRIVLTQTYANTDLDPSVCSEDVTVVQAINITATYKAPASCADPYFSVEIPLSVDGAKYVVTQGDPATYNEEQTGDGGTLTFTGLTPGGGFKVTATTETAACPSTTECAAAAGRPGNPVTETKATSPVNNSLTSKIADIYKIALESPTKVNATPNPFTEKVRFDLVSGLSGYGTLELYNVVGQRVGIVYQGYIQAGRPLVREYSVTKESRGNLIYVFKVGDQQVTGKLINLR